MPVDDQVNALSSAVAAREAALKALVASSNADWAEAYKAYTAACRDVDAAYAAFLDAR